MAQYEDPILIADAMGLLVGPSRAKDNRLGKGIKQIVICQGMCTPIRYHMLSLLRPYHRIWDSIDLHTHAVSILGNRGVDGYTLGFDRQLVGQNVAELTMSGELAEWIEWLIYRHNVRSSQDASVRIRPFVFLSEPIKQYNLRWYKQHKNTDEEWRQPDCDPPKKDLEEGYKNREAYYRQLKEQQKAKPAAKPAPKRKNKNKKASWWGL